MTVANHSFGFSILVPGASQQSNPVPQRPVQQQGGPVREGKHHRHHHRGLSDEPQPGQPQLHAIPPAQEAVHRAKRMRCEDGRVPDNTTTCAIAGGGPAGMMLGLLLARAGVDVTVMEKHADFLRDFRGDTVHASTLRLLDELGLGERFRQLTHRTIDSLRFQVQGIPIEIDLRRIPGAYKQIALVPQWDFLEMLATAAEAEPTFRLMRSSEVLGALQDDGRVVGVTYRDSGGETRKLRADLTVACDGRVSTLRSAMGLVPRSFGAPMDVWWFRLPRYGDDPQGLAGYFGAGHAAP